MAKFKFQGSEENTKNTLEVEVDTLEDVLYHFELFLQGCGYEVEGQLKVVPYDNTHTH
jgi:hypothetical protein